MFLPKSWSELTWQQLCDCWEVKMRYGGNADVARAAAVLALMGLKIEDGRWKMGAPQYDSVTGERVFLLTDVGCGMTDGERVAATVSLTARELAHVARVALPWFDWPYGDPGEKEQTDEKGGVVKEGRDPHSGYVSGMHDAMMLPITETEVDGVLFALPQAACANLTWEQYRALQLLAPQLFAEDITEKGALELQAKFVANCLVPAQDAEPSADKFAAKHVFKYDALRAERTIPFWRERLVLASEYRHSETSAGQQNNAAALFHICFQVYQTAISYYATVYPLLFNGEGKSDPLQDALTGEMGTINAVMMKAHYTSQQEVYDTNLPFILDILNTMAREAKEIEKMNAKIKKH